MESELKSLLMRKKSVLLTFLLTILLTIFSWFGTSSALAFTEEQKLVLQSWRIVNQAYLDDSFNHQNWWLLREKFLKKPLTTREQAYQAIEEMLGTLDDPFTRLLRPEQYRSLKVNTSGELSGVGVQISVNPETGILEVIAPIDGSPAFKAGIKPHDQILAIDDISTSKLTLDEAAAKMRGLIGTKVSLTIQPQGETESHIVQLVRNRISLNPVLANLDKPQDSAAIGYIRLNQFSANAPQEMAHAIAQLEQQGAQGYILDLRNNPGGLLQAGIEIARLWLKEGTIVYTVNRQGISDSFDSDELALTEAPLVLLVNQGTASASEILAGALQDNGRALLVGEKTFGKGLIQSLFELSDGSGLAITVAKYETPNHKDIHKQGIMPNEIVTQKPITLEELGTSADEQYQTAVKILNTQLLVAQAS